MRISGATSADSTHAIEAARLKCGSGMGGQIQYRVLSLLRQRLSSVPLAGDGGSSHASPALHGGLAVAAANTGVESARVLGVSLGIQARGRRYRALVPVMQQETAKRTSLPWVALCRCGVLVVVKISSVFRRRRAPATQPPVLLLPPSTPTCLSRSRR